MPPDSGRKKHMHVRAAKFVFLNEEIKEIKRSNAAICLQAKVFKQSALPRMSLDSCKTDKNLIVIKSMFQLVYPSRYQFTNGICNIVYAQRAS